MEKTEADRKAEEKLKRWLKDVGLEDEKKEGENTEEKRE